MTAPSDLGRLVPGFDFLQNLMKGAGAALPGLQGLAGGSLPGFNQWVAPTLDPAELDKRIQDLKAVQFWLESNAKLLASTIQALEVQRMTLATLKTMNLPMADLAEALKAKPSAPAPAPSPAPAEPPPAPAPAAAKAAPKSAEAPAAGVDPMQWWGALTQQFTDIAAKAMADVQGGAEQAARAMAAGAQAAKVTPPKASGKAATKAATNAAGKAAAARKTAPAAPARKSATRAQPAAGKTRGR